MLQAVVFDFDGVIANTEPLHLAAYQEVLEKIGMPLKTEDYYDRYLGFDDLGVFEAIAHDHDRRMAPAELHELIHRKAGRYASLIGQRDVIFPGAADCVRGLAADVPLAIASGSLRGEIEAVLERAGLAGHFRAIVAAGDTPRGKPAPDPYLRAVDLIRMANGAAGFDNTGFVAVEDSPWGLLSARAAGLRSVAVAQTYASSELTDADLVVPGLEQLTLDLLRTLAGT